MAAPIGKRYARALLELAQESNQLPKIGKDLDDLDNTWAESAELRAVFATPEVTAEARRKVIEGMAARMGLAPFVKTLLFLLSDRRRMRYLPDVIDAYRLLSESIDKQLRAEITTAVPMPETYYAQVQKELERGTGQKILLTRKEDPSIIGGVITRLGDRVLDGSLKTRLMELQDQLHDR
ncbi:MAG: ATP synthase F1 subunit delta [Deltaproteobacteria bacterium]|nr:MAG: ATP synthase F1 subunit delta [Deltaproteobacteria bacterium]